MRVPIMSIYHDIPEYIPNYRIVDKQRNKQEYMINKEEGIPDIIFLNSLSDASISSLLEILIDEQIRREMN